MANYNCACRSSYFKIGRPKEFLEWLSTMPDLAYSVKEQQTPDPKDFVVMIYVENSDQAGWPCSRYEDENAEDEIEIDFVQELSEFLAPGEVAIFMEVGNEKLRYLYGNACAVNDKGECLIVNLHDIYERVKTEWNTENYSYAEY